MAVQLRLKDTSTIGFDFIAASAPGSNMIVDPTMFDYESEIGVYFFDAFYGVEWIVRGAGVGSGTVSVDSLGPVLVSDFDGFGDFPAGAVVANVTGIQKSAFGESTFLNLDFMMENTWDELFDVGGDRVFLSNYSDVIGAGIGNDKVKGRGGDDDLFGEAGKDRLFGGGGDDDLFGGTGKDQLKGQGGDDDLAGGASNDRLFGGGGIDNLMGDAGRDKLYGGNGDDGLTGGAGDDTVYGGKGSDIINGAGGRDKLFGGADIDNFWFQLFSDDDRNQDTIVDFKDDFDQILVFAIFAIDVDLEAVIDDATSRAGGIELDFGGGNTLFVRSVFDADILRDDMEFQVF